MYEWTWSPEEDRSNSVGCVAELTLVVTNLPSPLGTARGGGVGKDLGIRRVLCLELRVRVLGIGIYQRLGRLILPSLLAGVYCRSLTG